MRKAQQQEILELVNTLHEAHAEVKGSVEKRQNHIAQSILADCQECAISIGNVIEAFEGEGFVTISFLEEYCQVLFQSHESLNDINVNENRIYKNLEKQLIRIENSIKNDISIRKEIAFFPYKASMWDSLESIYLAAKEDPNVDAYCVPIPYYDLKPDRSFGQMHYEGLEYPKNIEVIDWQTYNFEERKPDVIYIHNPYDNWNLVTSVHPRFYSDRLKAATEELVYVPYFVLQEIEPTDQNAIDGMKHFCYLPGIINADKVIVQSEKMKQIYVNEYYKAAKANGLTGKHIDRTALEEKFLGLGSPKFDKVKNTKKEDLEIPVEWLKIIEKPDGSWKKIIFYNTSIAALLEHNEKMLEKMKWVFNVFKENKDEVALLWRPHPLIKNTVAAMRPQLWPEYDRLVQQYKAEGWGIYDDTADMDRAVVLSDAYYGDSSSVVQVYQQTGKPVMVQNVNMREYDWRELFYGKGICKKDGSLFIPMAMMPGFIKCNSETGEVVAYKDWRILEKNRGTENYWYTDVVCEGDLLFFSPTNAGVIAVYNCIEDSLSQIQLRIPENYKRIPSIHSTILKVEDKIFFIGVCNTTAIVMLDIKTFQTRLFGEMMKEQKSCLYGRNAAVKNNLLYIPVMSEGKVMCIDYVNDKEYLFTVDEKQRKFVSMHVCKDMFYLTTEDGCLLMIDADMNMKKEILVPNHHMFFSSYCNEKYLWLFPFDANETAIKLDLQTGAFEEFQVPKRVYDVVEGKEEKLMLNAKGCMMVLDMDNSVRTVEYHTKKMINDYASFKEWLGYDLAEGEREGCPEYNNLLNLLAKIKKGKWYEGRNFDISPSN